MAYKSINYINTTNHKYQINSHMKQNIKRKIIKKLKIFIQYYMNSSQK